MCCNSSCIGQKLMKLKVNTNFIFTFEVVNVDDILCSHAESCFFLPLLNPLFYYGNLKWFSTGPV